MDGECFLSGADDEPEADEPEADRVMAEEFELSQESGGELVPQPLLSSQLGNLTSCNF